MLCFLRKNKVYTSVIWMLMTVTTYSKNVDKGEEIVANIIQQYGKPLNDSTVSFKSWMHDKGSNKTVEQFIRQTVKELKPYLEDDTVEDIKIEDDKITLEGDDETTIIEFSPNIRASNRNELTKTVEKKAKDFQENLQKYKKLRSKIKKALKREKVTNKTKILVTKTLDKMIAQMIAHRCSWSDGVQNRGMMDIETNRKGLNSVIQAWKKQWSQLKHQYNSSNIENADDAEMSKDKFLKKFEDLVSIMGNDLSTVAGKYKVVCKYADIHNKDKTNTDEKDIVRTDKNKLKYLSGGDIQDKKLVKLAAENAVLNNNYDDTLPCSHFKICSDELMQFLLDFYITFNDTAVNVITNYAAMFLRDVSDDSYHEKERVVKLIMNIAKIAENKVEAIFKKQTKKLKFTKDNRFENIKVLYNYVAKTLERFKKTIHKEVENSLKSVKDKLMHIIQKDIDVNTAMDLDNLERDVTGGICHIFEVCNGVVFGTRKRNYIGDKNNVYVKVQLKLEEDENNERALINPKIKQSVPTKYPLRFRATRTTPIINKLVLKLEPSFNQNNDMILKAKQIIVNDKETKNLANASLIPNTDQIVLNMNPSVRLNEKETNIKDIKSEDVKVKITFLEENKVVEKNKTAEERAPTKRNNKRKKLRNLRKLEYKRQLSLNGDKNQTDNIYSAEDVKLNMI